MKPINVSQFIMNSTQLDNQVRKMNHILTIITLLSIHNHIPLNFQKFQHLLNPTLEIVVKLHSVFLIGFVCTCKNVSLLWVIGSTELTGINTFNSVKIKLFSFWGANQY